VECQDPKGIFAVVGNFPEVETGETLNFVGDWIEHSKFGRQFQATSFESVANL
jgi:exodeoxyribonuclease V alpha subunit